MSDCGVCLRTGIDFGDNDFSKWIAAFKTAMECCECGRSIPAGEKHEKARFRSEDDGKWIIHHTCSTCAEIAWAFFCDARLYEGLWDRMDEVFEVISLSCFERLKSPEAKKELQRRWMEWKGLPL